MQTEEQEEINKPLLTNTEMSKIAECSVNSVRTVLNGKHLKDKFTEDKIVKLVEFETTLKKLILDNNFSKAMEVVITKGRNSELIKFAVIAQQFSNNLRYRLETDLTDEKE